MNKLLLLLVLLITGFAAGQNGRVVTPYNSGYAVCILGQTCDTITTDLVTVPAIGRLTKRTTSAVLRDMVSVKDYGAKGDGSTDDYDAINFALNSNLCVRFPPGVYFVDNTRNVAGGATNGGLYPVNKNICLQFDKGASIEFKDYGHDGVFITNPTALYLENVEIWYKTVRSTCDPSAWSETTTQNCISFRNNARALDVECPAGLASQDINLRGVYVHDAPSAGLTIGNCNDAQISDTRVDRNLGQRLLYGQCQPRPHGKHFHARCAGRWTGAEQVLQTRAGTRVPTLRSTATPVMDGEAFSTTPAQTSWSMV